MTDEELIERLGKTMQVAMHLLTKNRELRERVEVAEERAEILEELVMDIVADMQDGVLKSVILERINKVMQKLDGED